MIEVKTNFPIAVDSADHIYPEGVHYDNNVNMTFIESLEAHFNGNKINFLDLGCAGGALAVTLHDRGHKAVGIDGSDGCLNVRPEVMEHFGGVMPKGHDNWVKHFKTILHTADITKDYDILEDGVLMQFDAITCWDVMEHFDPAAVDNFLKQIHKHLKPGGIFMGTIALFPSGATNTWRDNADVQYHKSVFNKQWWVDKISNYLTVQLYPLYACNRNIPMHAAYSDQAGETLPYYMFAASKV